MVIVMNLAATFAFAELKWETDFRKAKQFAKASNRYMMLNFTGSDWCGWCIRLDKEVFSKKEFTSYADENLVCGFIDFPRNKRLKKTLMKQNDELQSEYNIRGFPAILILSPTGKEVARTGYKAGGAEAYVEHLKQFIDPHRNKNDIPGPTPIEAEKNDNRSKLSLQSQAPPLLPKDNSRELRTWTSQSGAIVRASIVEEMTDYVLLRKADGSKTMIRKSNLRQADIDYIEGLKKAGSSQ
jgi:protein disulfide-isomerase